MDMDANENTPRKGYGELQVNLGKQYPSSIFLKFLKIICKKTMLFTKKLGFW